MKVKTINRSEEACTRERAQDVVKVHRNLDPALHPFDRAVEYTRALAAAKTERLFARPFLAALPHDDGVTCLARNPLRLGALLSGAADGGVRLWDVAARRCLRRLVGHTGAVRGLAHVPSGDAAVSASTDATVKLWRVPFAPFDGGPVEEDALPVAEWVGAHPFLGVDHHWQRPQFVTAGAAAQLWDHARGEPVAAFTWGADSLSSARFNPAEPDLFATTGSDRGVALYDLRAGAPVRKLVMQAKTNAVAWNPMEPLNFTLASDDACLYTYDMRRLAGAACVHKDFVSAVMDVDFSPTGREFVAGSYDRTVRLFASAGGHSRDVYHAKRQQRVFAVRFSGDGAYVFSGSDDMNVRLWKADAAAQLGTLLPRERAKAAYSKALVERHRHMPEVKRVARHRHVPAAIHKASKLRRAQEDSERRRAANRAAHSAPGAVPLKPARRKKVVAELE
jgi:WD repeat and SOF domain-containing protein 1